MRTYSFFLLTVSFVGMLLTSCSTLESAKDTVKDSLGLGHDQADEYNVGEGRPLTLPPSYDRLPEPPKKKKGSKDSDIKAQSDAVKGSDPGQGSESQTRTDLVSPSSETSQIEHEILEKAQNQ